MHRSRTSAWMTLVVGAYVAACQGRAEPTSSAEAPPVASSSPLGNSCPAGHVPSVDDVEAWSKAGKPKVALRPISDGAKILSNYGDDVCAKDCKRPQRLRAGAQGSVECVAPPPPPAKTGSVVAMNSTDSGPSIATLRCMDPPCGPPRCEDAPCDPPSTKTPRLPLLGIVPKIDVDITTPVETFAKKIISSPVLRKKGRVHAVWDHPESSTEDFVKGMAGFQNNLRAGEDFALFVTPELLWRLIQLATGSPNSVSPLAIDQLYGQITTTCPTAICPLTFTAKMRMNLSVQDGAVQQTSQL